MTNFPGPALDGVWERDDRYEGMSFEEAWADYFRRHPESLAVWGHNNGRMPNDDLVRVS